MLIDVNTSLGHWPSQVFAQDTAARLARHLRAEGIARALVSSMDAAFYPDFEACHQRLTARLAPHPELVPLPTVNPELPGWNRLLDAGDARAVRVLPGYHGYTLEAAGLRTLAARLCETGRVLMIQVRMEDERSHHPLCRIPPVDGDGIRALAGAFPELPIVCLCPYLKTAVELAAACPNIHFDLSMVEQLDTLDVVLERVAAEQVLFGSHTPFLTTRAAVMKLRACTAAPEIVQKIAAGNARRLLVGHSHYGDTPDGVDDKL